MKCPNCGGELLENAGKFVCQFCGSSYVARKKNPSQDAGFLIIGGVLKKYSGNQANVIIPDNVLSIGDSAFEGNLMIKTITFGPSVSSIGNKAFAGCVNLVSIANYDSVVSYGSESFANTAINNVTIGSNVEFLGKYCFLSCNNLEKVIYKPGKNLKLDHTFAKCSALSVVEMDSHYFFPSFAPAIQVRNNPGNKRPTFADAFSGTPFFSAKNKEYMSFYARGVCPECGDKIAKGLFHSKCNGCGIDYKN